MNKIVKPWVLNFISNYLANSQEYHENKLPEDMAASTLTKVTLGQVKIHTDGY